MTDLCRKWTITSSVVLTLIGFGLSIAAILTPSWQVVNLREYNSIHEHGLWLDCTRHSRDGNVLLRRWFSLQNSNWHYVSCLFRYATVTEPLHCVYKFDYDKYSGTFDLEDDNSPVGEVNRHKFYGKIFNLIKNIICLIFIVLFYQLFIFRLAHSYAHSFGTCSDHFFHVRLRWCLWLLLFVAFTGFHCHYLAHK